MPVHRHVEQVDLSNEEDESQDVVAALLVILTVGLLLTAVAQFVIEARRLSGGDGDGSDDGQYSTP